MKRQIFGSVAVLAIVAIAAFNVNVSTTETDFLDIEFLSSKRNFLK